MTTSHQFNPLDHRILFMSPQWLTASGWHVLVPFAMLLVDLLRPRVLVEVGASDGASYCAFCQAIQHLGLAEGFVEHLGTAAREWNLHGAYCDR